MLASALQLVPTARRLAAMLVAIACALHYTGWLPDRSWLLAALLALPLLLALGLVAATVEARQPAVEAQVSPAGRGRGLYRLTPGRLAWRRGLHVMVASARLGNVLLFVGALILWQVHDALQSRLPAPLEGHDLEVVGFVDGMPQRSEFGDRVLFSLTDCRAAGTANGCGRLARVQLDWGPLREKDRVGPFYGGGHDGGHDGVPADGHGSARGDPFTEDDVWPQPGQYWRLTVRLRRPVAPVNPGGFDLELRYLQQGIGAIGRVRARQLLEPPQWRAVRQPGSYLLTVFESWRTVLRDRLEGVHSSRLDWAGGGHGAGWPLVGVVEGLALGDQGAISGKLWALFSRTGVSHLMAISGAHVTMLALVAAWMASRILSFMTLSRVPGTAVLFAAYPRQCLVLLIAVLVAFGYALLSGWGIPAQRTCWMLAVAAVMSVLGRGISILDVTLLAAAIVIVADPWAVATAGFWLSFGAVAAILWRAHGQDRRRPSFLTVRGFDVRVPHALREACTSQWAATIGLAPLVIALFSTWSLIGPVANAIAIPWVSLLVTPLAIAATLFAPVSEAGCALLLQLNLWLIQQLVAVLEFLDSLPAANFAIARPGAWTLIAALIGAAVMIAPRGVPMRRAGVLCLLPLLMAPQRLPPADELWVTVLDIGQGSSVLVESADKRLLFDAGPGQGVERSAAARFLIPYLRSRGIETIDTLVVSHLDAEHAGGAASVLQALRPRQMLTGFDARLLQTEGGLRSDTKALRCSAGQRFALGAATVDVLHPAAAAMQRSAARDNRSSCVIRISSSAGSVLLPGDLPATAESQLLRAARSRGVAGNQPSSDKHPAAGEGVERDAILRSDVLIVPQQGSRNAAGALLLEAVKPAYAVLQAGYRNRHGHPHATVLQRLEASGAAVLRTDQDGAVQIRLRGARTAQIRHERRDQRPYWRIDTSD